MGIFDLFKSKNVDARKNYLKELIRVAKADGFLEKSEYEFIFKVSQKLQCSAEDLESITREVENESGDNTTQARRRRLELILDMVGIMMIDGTIDPKEVSICKSIAMKSGFEHSVIDDIVHRIQKLTKEGNSIEEACANVYYIYRNA